MEDEKRTGSARIRYRKKPIVVDAWRWLGKPLEFRKCPDWIWDADCILSVSENGKLSYLAIETLEGEMRVNKGDWIIRGIEGEFYPCKPKIFTATYDRIKDSTDGR